jgi:plastocyanin
MAFGPAACSAGEETAPTGTTAPAPPPKAEREAAKKGEAVDVVMRDTQFVPDEVSVPVRGTITWTNEDPFAHTVTKESGPGADFDSGDVDDGGTFEQSFGAAGEIAYMCTIHPQMTGTITVEK